MSGPDYPLQINQDGYPRFVKVNHDMTQQEYLEKLLAGCKDLIGQGQEKSDAEKAKDNVLFLGRCWELARAAGFDELRDEYRLDLEMAMEEERELDFDSAK